MRAYLRRKDGYGILIYSKKEDWKDGICGNVLCKIKKHKTPFEAFSCYINSLPNSVGYVGYKVVWIKEK